MYVVIGAEHFGSDFAMAQRKTHSPSKKLLPYDKYKYHTIFLCISVIIQNSNFEVMLLVGNWYCSILVANVWVTNSKFAEASY